MLLPHTYTTRSLPTRANCQDAAEYWGHLLEVAARAEHAGRARIGLGTDAVSLGNGCIGPQQRAAQQASTALHHPQPQTLMTSPPPPLATTQALLPGLFSFALEDRTQCLETGAVRRGCDFFLGLQDAHCGQRLWKEERACKYEPCAYPPQVSYRRTTSTQLSLHIPLEAAVNAADVERYKERQVGVRHRCICVRRVDQPCTYALILLFPLATRFRPNVRS